VLSKLALTDLGGGPVPGAATALAGIALAVAGAALLAAAG
jgi:hypothetical protein